MVSRCFVLTLLVLVGCNRESEHVRVVGVVRCDGKPLAFGSIMFQPLGSGGIARSAIEADGTFELVSDNQQRGVAPGICRVRITSFENQRQPAQGNVDREPTLGASAIPKKYQNFGTSGIEVDVHPDMKLPMEIDLDG